MRSSVSVYRRVLRWLSIGAATPPTHEDVVRRRVVSLAWPAVVEGLLQTAIGLVDTFFVARVSDVALAGVGTALQLVFIMIVVMSAVSVGASVLVAQSVGAQEFIRARALTRQALVLAVLLSLPLSAVGVIFASPLIHVFGVAADVGAVGVDYWRITAYGLVIMTVMFVASAVLRGAGDTKTSMRATLLANGVNGVLAYLLIFGRLGFPELGPSGSAWASVAGRAVALAVMLSVLLRSRTSISIRGWHDWLPRPRIAKRMLGIGMPAAIEELIFLNRLRRSYGSGSGARHRGARGAAHRLQCALASVLARLRLLIGCHGAGRPKRWRTRPAGWAPCHACLRSVFRRLDGRDIAALSCGRYACDARLQQRTKCRHHWRRRDARSGALATVVGHHVRVFRGPARHRQLSLSAGRQLTVGVVMRGAGGRGCHRLRPWTVGNLADLRRDWPDAGADLSGTAQSRSTSGQQLEPRRLASRWRR